AGVEQDGARARRDLAGHEVVSVTIIMGETVTSSIRRALCVTFRILLARVLRADLIWADHGVQGQPDPWRPALVAMLSAVLFPTVGIAVPAAKWILTKRP